MIVSRFYKSLFFIFFLGFSVIGFSQSGKQKALEERRQELRREIQQHHKLISESKSKQRSELSLLEDLNYKINALNSLIKITNEQANLLTREINNNQKKITELREELKQLKEAYAQMIVKSYKNKNKQSRVMFLLSSQNFKQAYKRLQYIKQYANYQKQQGETIKGKAAELQETNISLLKQKEDKKKLIAENRIAQKELQVEKNEHKTLMAAIKRDLSKYTAQVRRKQREANRIDREIEKIIRAAIASSNKKAGKSETAKTFALTPEEKVLASQFVSNKGKLPWPVEKGVVKVRYGKQRSPIDNSIFINSNGVRIATEKNAEVRAVFNGEVFAVQAIKRGNPTVLIKHGNYITVYKNLSKVYVKKGDKVSTKQTIGRVFTDSRTNESMLSFVVFRESLKTEDPSHWIYRM